MKKFNVLAAIDYIVLICVICLTLIGIAFIYSSAIDRDGVLTNSNYIKQIIWGITGIILMIFFACYDYRKMERYIPYVFYFSCLVLLYTCFFGKVVKGSRSWLGIGSFGIQPSEFCKVIFILFLAKYLNESENENPTKRFIKSTIYLLVVIGLLMLQPDLGTSLVFIPIFLFMMLVSGIEMRYIILVLGVGTFTILFTILPVWESGIVGHPVAAIKFLTDSRLRLVFTLSMLAIMIIGLLGLYFYRNNKYYYWISFFAGIILISLIASKFVGMKLKPFQLKRLIIFLNPEVDPRGAGWNIIQSKVAIGAGGFFGRGFLKGTQSHLSYLPEQGTDFIFSILCEEWGFLGGFLVFALYLCLMLRMVHIIKTTPNKYGAYITTGILGMFFFHFLENIGMVMGLMPCTGIPLLFLSYGGSSLWTSMICMGIVMAVKYRRFNFMN
ncbi:MAG: rod shape-determining protein RodA [Treponema sp.]|nr:rod shape-determining protein RodA [Candidatus Treponema scatequi]